jgi:hypothetical protein
MNPPFRSSPLFASSLLLAWTLSGCATARIIPVAKGPATSLELPGSNASLKTTVENVIVRHGPGS